MHYAELTRLALVNLTAGPDDLFRAKEDVREKMLLAGRYGTAYTGQPECFGIVRDWFPSPQTPLLNLDARTIRIAGSASSAEMAAFEAVMRARHMIQKHPNADPEKRFRGLARGMAIEHHVSPWFRDKWPGLYRDAENKGVWHEWCSHDFRLDLPSIRRMVEVDVMGPLGDGDFGVPNGKQRVDIHVMASIDGDDVILHGFRPGPQLSDRFAAENTMPPQMLIVWLNCESIGIDYREIAARITTATGAA